MPLMLISIILSISALMPKPDHRREVERMVRNKVVLLQSQVGICSGSVVNGASGRTYILTAGHCAHESMAFVDIPGIERVPVELVEKNEAYDIAIYSAPRMEGLCIAKSVRMHEKIMSISHGHGLPAFRTDGEIVELFVADISDEIHLPLVLTTMPVIHGSSGAPAVNEDGCVVGTVSITAEDEMAFSGISRLSAIQRMLAQH